MVERKKQNENTLWTEILRSSVKVLDETLIPGEYGAIVAQGTLNGAKETKTCSLKMLKGNNIDRFGFVISKVTHLSSPLDLHSLTRIFPIIRNQRYSTNDFNVLAKNIRQ